MFSQLENKVLCGLSGLYAGDAYGLPMEMMPREHVFQVFGRVEDLVTLDERVTLDGYWYRPIFPRGRGSDDTYFNTYVIEKYITDGKMDEKVTAQIFSERIREILDTPFYGPSTLAAIGRIMKGQDPATTGLPGSPLSDGQSCGAATLRSTPIGMANPGNPKAAALEAAHAALPTHGSRVALSAASAWAAAVACAMSDHPTLEAIRDAALLGAEIGSYFGRTGIYSSVSARIELAWKIAADARTPQEAANQLYDIIGAGLPANETVPTSLGIFFACSDDVLGAILTAANVGGDTDSTASMAGALAGVYSGTCNIPQDRLAMIEQVNQIKIRDLSERFSAWIWENRA